MNKEEIEEIKNLLSGFAVISAFESTRLRVDKMNIVLDNELSKLSQHDVSGELKCDNKKAELDNKDKKLHISDVSDSSSTQMWKDIKKWIIIIFSWIMILIFSLIFLDNKSMILGGWMLITGLVMWLKGKNYEKWYWKN